MSIHSNVLLAALISVESAGNDMAVGDGGLAIGALQIHQCVVADVNRRYGTHYTHSGMTNRAAAVDVFHKYLSMYATPQRLRRAVTDEDRARIWNGGPNGYRKTATDGYWHKVRNAIRNLTR